MARDHKMTLAGLPLRVAPEEMRWNFQMKVADTAAVAGKVIQIVGVSMSDITLRGKFSPDRKKGDTEAWEQAMRFRERIKDLAKAAAGSHVPSPVRLTYPPRGWDFDVFIKSITPVSITVDTIAPEWELTLFPIGEGANKVVKGVKDLYIQRLMNGIGWKQTSYNGPMTQDIVDQELGGLGVQDYIAQGAGEAFAGGFFMPGGEP